MFRVSNFYHEMASVYSPLADHSNIEYMTATGSENGRRLCEGEVDIALISSHEYAYSGEYEGLGFGLGVKSNFEPLVLYSKTELQRVHTVYLNQDSGSSLLLLRLLFRELWQGDPRLVRAGSFMSPDSVSEGEAVLTFHDAYKPKQSYPGVYETDIVKEWYDWTALPFVFLVWAARPGVLSPEDYKTFNETFHVGSKAINTTCMLGVSRTGVQYYLDDEMLAGLNHFYACCAHRRLLPDAYYKVASLPLMSDVVRTKRKKTSTERVLDNAIAGQRLNIAEARQLMEDASLGELGMVADLLRRRLFSNCVLRPHYILPEELLKDREEFTEAVDELSLQSPEFVDLIPNMESREFSLEDYVFAIRLLKESCACQVSALSVPSILRLLESYKGDHFELMNHLSDLDCVPSWGGGMLVQRLLSARKSASAMDWQLVYQWLHCFGIRAECELSLSGKESLDDCLVHLHRLRSIQDRTKGFRSFSLRLPSGASSQDEVLRTLAMARIFLDNVPSVHHRCLGADRGLDVLAASFGANELRVEIRDSADEALKATQAMIEQTWMGQDEFRI